MLNVAVGLVFSFAVGTVWIVSMLMAGWDIEEADRAANVLDRVGVIFWLVGPVGWLLFGYLPRPRRTRGLVLAGVWGGAIAIGALLVNILIARG